MWRSIFIAVGLMALIVGLECLVIDSATVYSADETRVGTFVNPMRGAGAATREWRPQEWMPWAILAGGAVVVIYAFTLPRRFGRAAAD